ncbi:MAG: ABC transporter substrate-binding protein [Prevotella sp.]|nr:ABC transporter substrate-binding protein [Prevotella sp.]
MRKCILLFVLLLSTLFVQGQPKRIVFTPQWHANVQFAGYIAARELGYYEEEGLDVIINYPDGTKTSIEMLREGKADLVLAFLMNAIETKTNSGLDMVNVMQSSQHSSLCLALKSPQEKLDVMSLKNLRVGLWSSNTAISAVAMNNHYHLNWTVVPFRGGIGLLSYGLVDAISVMEYNELQRLKYTGKDLSANSVFRMCDNGYDIPEEGAYCLRDYYHKNADAVKAFVRASKKGWAWCRKHQEEAVNMVTKEMHSEYVNNSKVFQTAGLKVVLKKQEVAPGKVSYILRRDQYEKAAKTLLEANLIHTIPDFQSFIAK